MTADNYNPATALTSYYPNRDERRPARLWAREKLLHDMADVGMVEFFEGPGTDPTALDGYATTKLWLRVASGVTAAPGEVRAYDGAGDQTLIASWPTVDRGAFLSFLGVQPDFGRFETRSDVIAATIAAGINGVTILGYASVGDGGAASYKRALTEPGHAGKLQSADGAWWELVADEDTNIAMYGGGAGGITAQAAHLGYVTFPKGNTAIEADITIDVPAWFHTGAYVTVAPTITLTFNNLIESERQHIFRGDGDISLLIDSDSGEDSKIAHVSWWGAFPGEAKGDQGAALNRAYASFGNVREGVLHFDNGVYGTNETIYVPRGVLTKGVGTRKTLFYPMTDGFPCFETQGDACHWEGIQFEVDRDVMPSRVSPYINVLHQNAHIDDVMCTNGDNAIVVDAPGARLRRIGFNHDQQYGAAGSALITIKKGNCTVDGIYGYLGQTYGPENLVHIAPTVAKFNGVTVRNIDTRARPRPIKVTTTTQSITGITIDGVRYDAVAGTAPDNIVEFNVAGGTYVQNVNISGINSNGRPVDGMTFNVADNGVLELVSIDGVNISGSTSPSSRTGIKFVMGAGSSGAIRFVKIAPTVNIIRPVGQELVIPADSRVRVEAAPIRGIGYTPSNGGAVTQATNRTTGVTINALCGSITLVSAAGSATPSSFTVSNNLVAATDVVLVSQKSGTDKYAAMVTAVAAGSFQVTVWTTGGTTTEQPVFSFAVIRAVTS